MNIEDRIQPYVHNPFYWQYKKQPVLLLGGSIEDNLFQISYIEEHLDLLHATGGNYVRCTMSSRDEGNAFPFERDPHTGRYDLHQPGEEYRRRFEQFLRLTAERDIVVQIELWDRFDFVRAPWKENPYNPSNNINYTTDDSGLLETIETHPNARQSAFFRSVPAMENNQVLLPYQRAEIDQLLSIALPYGNVLYCIDNETNESPEWGRYWATYIQQKASDAGVSAHVTEMWDAWDLSDPQHNATFDHPELYTFVDISQNNHLDAADHWQNVLAARQRVLDSGHSRPINSVKIYGANSGNFGSTRDGQERFWRNIFGGMASSRFHRPPSGLGLSAIAQAHIRSMRMLTDTMTLPSCLPHNDLLQNRAWNEAYCIANPGVEYAVFFPDGGNVLLDIAPATPPITIRWLDIRRSQWLDEQQVASVIEDRYMPLLTPAEEGYWAVLIRH